tara:strand:- start:385 stop:876 length:492 start_codon:yes stop_codon:yes gene_type:complete
MAKYLTIFLFLTFYGCETSSEQVIKSKNFSFEDVKFNAVSKKLIFENISENRDTLTAKENISNWFNSKIKLDGFEGELEVIVTSIIIEKIKEKQFYKYKIDINLVFNEKNQVMNYKKIYNVNSIEYGIIEGDFTLNDQERLNINTIKKSLDSITNKLLTMNND